MSHVTHILFLHIWLNVFGWHHDPQYWDEPWKFKPERYLDEDGKLVAPDHPNRRRYTIFVMMHQVTANNMKFYFKTFTTLIPCDI